MVLGSSSNDRSKQKTITCYPKAIRGCAPSTINQHLRHRLQTVWKIHSDPTWPIQLGLCYSGSLYAAISEKWWKILKWWITHCLYIPTCIIRYVKQWARRPTITQVCCRGKLPWQNISSAFSSVTTYGRIFYWIISGNILLTAPHQRYAIRVTEFSWVISRFDMAPTE